MNKSSLWRLEKLNGEKLGTKDHTVKAEIEIFLMLGIFFYSFKVNFFRALLALSEALFAIVFYSLPKASRHGNLFQISSSSAHLDIIPVTRVNKDHFHSVIHFALDTGQFEKAYRGPSDARMHCSSSVLFSLSQTVLT